MSLRSSKNPKVRAMTQWHKRIKKDTKSRSQRMSRRIDKHQLAVSLKLAG